MKARKRIQNPVGITSFNLYAPIIPLVGAGGVTFKNKLADFEYLLIEKSFDGEFRKDLIVEIDNEYYTLTLHIKNTALQIQFDILSGDINSIICGKGYIGALDTGACVGDMTTKNFFLKNKMGFDLDFYFFRRAPLDGLMIEPPGELRDACWDAGAQGRPYPAFEVSQILLLNPEYANKYFSIPSY